jgi:hypothetical protein
VLLRTPHRAPIHLAPSRPWRAPRPAEETTVGRVWQNRPIYTKSSTGAPANTLARTHFHLYKSGSPLSVTEDLGKSTSQLRP